MLAYQHHAPILPVCITTNTGVALLSRLTRVIISYGELIQPEELGNCGRDRFSEFRKASRLVMDRIAEMRERDEKMFPLSEERLKTGS